ncbi:hypothetical protein TNCV_1890871 [Trichonephila clavipes]|nr:hypothetical protein TNCV_1890871 [Trichonephila clavipes]
MEPQGSMEYSLNTTDFDFHNDQDDRILVFGEESLYLMENRKTIFLHGTFKSYPKQFSEIYTIYVNLRSKATETNVYPALFAILPDKRQPTYNAKFQKVKRWCPK